MMVYLMWGFIIIFALCLISLFDDGGTALLRAARKRDERKRKSALRAHRKGDKHAA